MAPTEEALDELMEEAAGYGFILHHIYLAREHAEEMGAAELARTIEEVEGTARLERNLALERVGDHDGS